MLSNKIVAAEAKYDIVYSILIYLYSKIKICLHLTGVDMRLNYDIRTGVSKSLYDSMYLHFLEHKNLKK